MKSNIHLNHVNLFWFYLFMKTIYMWIRNPNCLNWKPYVLNLCVCVNLSISTLVYLYTRSKHKLKSSYRTHSPSRLDPNTIQRACSNRVLDTILTRELLNFHVLAQNSFIEAKQLLRSWSITETYKHKIISTITYELIIIKTRVMGLWVNNLPLFDDDKTHGVIYAWIKDKLHRSSPLTHA